MYLCLEQLSNERKTSSLQTITLNANFCVEVEIESEDKVKGSVFNEADFKLQGLIEILFFWIIGGLFITFAII